MKRLKPRKSRSGRTTTSPIRPRRNKKSMAPRSLLQTVVRPNLQEFDADYGNIRRACNAVAAVDALMAHIYVWCKTNAPSEIAGLNNDSHYRGRLAGCSSDFRAAALAMLEAE